MKRMILVLVLINLTFSFSQKKAITHEDYKLWKTFVATLKDNDLKRDDGISSDGKYYYYVVRQIDRRGNKDLELKYLDEDFSFRVERGSSGNFVSDNRCFTYLVSPDYDLVYKMKLKKEKDLPMDTLKIFSLKDKKNVYWDNFILKTDILKENSNYLVYSRHKYKKIIDTIYETVPDSLFIGLKGKAEGFKMFYTKENRKKEEEKENVMLDLKTLKPFTFEAVTYSLSKSGNKIFFISEKKSKNKKEDKKPKKQYIKYLDYNTKKTVILDSSANFYKNIGLNNEGSRLVYLFSNDSLTCKEEDKKYSLCYANVDNKGKISKKIINNNSIPKNWQISPYSANKFSENGNRIFFDILPTPVKYEKDTNILESEKPKLDIWKWDDKFLQPTQKISIKRLIEKDYLAVYNIDNEKIIVLQQKNDEGIIYKNGDEDYVYAFSYSDPVENMWKSYNSNNFYSINIKNGERKLVLENQEYGIIPSYKGNYIAFYKNKKWNIYDAKRNKIIEASKDIYTNLYDEDYDLPEFNPSYGYCGWSKDENIFYICDRYDIWAIFSDENKKPDNITGYFGRNNKIRLFWKNFEGNEFKGFDKNNKITLLSGFNEETKDSGFYKLDENKPKVEMVISERNKNFSFLYKAKNNDRVIFSKQSFDTYPDIFLSDIKNYGQKRLTNINPQQKDFNWGTVELTKWKTFSGKETEGLIYKPENFDPAKKYPLLVYFYETHTGNKNRYNIPAPSASIINISYCVSNEYIVFVPDIRYQTGQPGEDAYDYIISGTEMMEKKGYIDTNRMALQGQSWGGYQTAYLITRTGKKFRAALAGAPVANMTSAYGGIRWKAGINRSMQYENGQSRLGVTMWENRDAYIKNSPLFFADKIETPLLIMNNDNDGAVPWYQGIEFYIALRRLRKPVWMLVYNGEEHNLMKIWNREDFTIRMMQFFDHYLKGKPAPKWMTEGIDQYQKKQEYYGFELDKN